METSIRDLKRHALKGIVSNASLDNLLAPIVEITEHLRAREDMDYAPLVDAIFSELDKYRQLAQD